jgi:hypothetical protein
VRHRSALAEVHHLEVATALVDADAALADARGGTGDGALLLAQGRVEPSRQRQAPARPQRVVYGCLPFRGQPLNRSASRSRLACSLSSSVSRDADHWPVATAAQRSAAAPLHDPRTRVRVIEPPFVVGSPAAA